MKPANVSELNSWFKKIFGYSFLLTIHGISKKFMVGTRVKENRCQRFDCSL